MRSGKVHMLGDRLVVQTPDGRGLNLPRPLSLELACPYCGGFKTKVSQERGDAHEWVRCGDCGEIIGWAAVLMRPCPECGRRLRSWAERGDGKVDVTCDGCGRYDPQPD